jgi:4a-hydroxytetrahydrobiopterin dehydratase
LLNLQKANTFNTNRTSGHSSVVERLVANEKVVGSSPIARSIKGFYMSDLANKKCVPCEGNIPPFNTDEIHKYLKKIDGWDVKSDDEKTYYLIKQFKFNNFLESQDFINKVGVIAEKEGHHPDIWFGWGYAKIKIFTHAINGLHESDFVLAAKIDKISSV